MTLVVRNFNYPLPHAGLRPDYLPCTPSFTVDSDETVDPEGATVDNGTLRSSHYSSETGDSELWTSQGTGQELPLDADGRIDAYVDFGEFYQAIQRLEASQQRKMTAQNGDVEIETDNVQEPSLD